MVPGRLISLPATVAVVGLCVSVASAQSTIKKEIDVGFAPIEVVKPVLEKALSPQGKFVMLPNKGSVMVIDSPDGILSAENALAEAELPVANVELDFQFVTGLPPRRQEITVAQEVPFPVEFAPPTIIVGPQGSVSTVIPATPTRFQKRNIGVTSTSSATLNPDGSITMDIDLESSEFEGFVNYGSAILPSGTVGTVPVLNSVGDPVFFAPFINAGDIHLPIISTTRISTSIVIRPRVNLGTVELDMMPRLGVLFEGEEIENEHVVDLKKYRATLAAQNGETGRAYGFAEAGDDFNRRFFGAENPSEGSTAVVVKVRIHPPGEDPAPALGQE